MGETDSINNNDRSGEQLFLTQNWVVYRSDDSSHFVRYDKAVVSLTQQQREQYLHTIDLFIPFVSPDIPAENRRLNRVEDEFFPADYDIKLVGVMSYGDGKSYILICNIPEQDIGSAVNTLLSANAGIKYSYELFLNDYLGYYDRVLAPSKYEAYWMLNRQICDNIQDGGDSLTQPRDIDFCCDFPSERYIQKVSDILQQQGFTETGRNRTQNGDYLLELVLVDIPSFEKISELTRAVLDALDGTDGNFNGWGTSPIRDTQ